MSGIVLDVTVNDDGSVNLKSLANALGKVGDESDKAGKKGKKSMDSIGESAKKMSSAVTRYAMDIRTQLGMALGSAGMGMLVKQGLAYNATLESISAQFEVITGSASEAAAIMKDLVDFAAKTPFELVEVANSAKILRAFGIEGNDSLRIVGDAAAAAQRPLEEVAMVFGRIKSGAFGEAFMRLAEMGIATREMLEGKGLQFDRSGSYKGSAAQALAAVQEIVNERFGGMMEKQSTMWTGLMSTLRDAWSALIGKITGPLFDELKPKITELTNAIGKMADSQQAREWGQALAEGAGKAIDGIRESTAWLVAHKEGLGETLKLARDVGIAVGAIVVATKAWATAQTIVNAVTALNPVARILSIILLVSGAVYEIVQRTIGWRNLMEKIGEFFKNIFQRDMARASMQAAMWEGNTAAAGRYRKELEAVGKEIVTVNEKASAFTQTMMGSVGLAMPGVPYMLDRKNWSPPAAAPAGGGSIADETSEKATRRLEKATAALKNYTAAKLEFGQSAYVGKYDALGRPSDVGPYTMEELQAINKMIEGMIPIKQNLWKGMPKPTKSDIAEWKAYGDAGKLAMRTIAEAASMAANSIGSSIANAVFDSKARLIELKDLARQILGMVLSYGIRFGLTALGVPMVPFASGGVVPGYGTRDSVPAMLTPRERVLTVQQNSQFEALGGLAGMRAALAGGGGGTLNLAINVRGNRRDADELEEILVPVLERWVDRRRINLARSR